MESENTFNETRRTAALKEAWGRFVDFSHTVDDTNLILDSIRKGDDLHESHEALDRIWDEALVNDDTPLEPEELQKYKSEAGHIYSELERIKKMREMSVSSRKIRRLRKIWYAAAAVFLLGLLIPVAYRFLNQKTEQTESIVQYVELSTGCGEIKTITLPDQTKVTLNVESSLKYPAVFTNERMVELLGGAIFEVTPDSKRPFTVATTGINVSVLGTVFDVKAYPDDGLSIVTVASGKVEVEIANNNILLEKDRQLKIDRESGSLDQYTIDAGKYLSWTDGILYFHRTPVNEVVHMLNRSQLQLIFELAEGEYPNLITGRLDTKKLETMLNPIINSIGLKYRKTGNKIILYNDKNANNKYNK